MGHDDLIPTLIVETSEAYNIDRTTAYTRTNKGTFVPDENGDWVQIDSKTFQEIRRFTVGPKWDYIKGSESDFEGAPDWAMLKTKWSCFEYYAERHVHGAPYVIVGGNGDVKRMDSRIVGFDNMPIIAQRQPAAQTRRNDELLSDAVNSPKHYADSTIECIDAIEASMSREEFQGYLKGNVQKYVWRYRHKGGVEDLKKSQWYANRLISNLETQDGK